MKNSLCIIFGILSTGAIMIMILFEHCSNGDIRYILNNNKLTSDFIFNCGNIHEIKIKSYLGHGASKLGFIGDYRGRRVVVKYAKNGMPKQQLCWTNLQEKKNIPEELKEICNNFPVMKVLKEILVMHELKHPNVVKMLGYCIRNNDKESEDLGTHGAISVFEYGGLANETEMKLLPWHERLRHVREVTSLLDYLENSPLGSLRYADIKLKHFVFVNSHLKMYDIDSVSNIEPPCVNNRCLYNIKCRDDMCDGFNAKFNMEQLQFLFEPLVKEPFPTSIADKLTAIMRDIMLMKSNASNILDRLSSIESPK